MTFLENRWIIIVLLMFCWASSTSLLAGYYYLQYDNLSAKLKGNIISANISMKIGGNPAVWFNGSETNAGSTLLDVTRLVVSVNYTENPLGATIDAIDNVSNAYPMWWMWWSWSSYGWTLGSVASDRYIVGDNETILWYYQDISTYPPPPPP